MKSKIKNFVYNRAFIITLSLCLGIITSFVGVTFYYVWVFMHPTDLLVHGKLKSDIAKEYRADLLTHYGAQEITFKSLDNVTLKGLLFKQNHAEINVLLCHGYRGMKETMKSLIPFFKNANIFLFDFRGHGESEWSLITCGYQEANDVKAAARLMHSLCDDDHKRLPLLTIGVSMGAAASIKAVAEEPDLFDGLIIDSTYAQLEPMIRRIAKRLLHIKENTAFAHFKHNLHPVIPFFMRHPFAYFVGRIMNYQARFSLTSFKPYSYLERITKPCAIFHSITDEVIPVSNAHTLHEAAKRAHVPLSLWIAPPCHHAFLNRKYPEQYKEKIDAFLQKHFPSYKM